MRIILGLTGPTGSGKSTLCDIARDMGVQVINCDKVARDAVIKGSRGLSALVSVFGEDILNTDKTLDRSALAKKAFKDNDSTELLNKTLLPIITEMIKEMITGEAVLLDAPTLFESGLNDICAETVAVLADKDFRLKRIMQRDNIDSEYALLRMNAGKSDEFYIKHADRCFYNNGSLTELQNEIKPYLKTVFERN